MKKVLAMVLCIVMALTLAVGVMAKISFGTSVPKDIGTLVVQKTGNQDDVTEFNSTVVNLAKGGTSFCPKTADCWVRYEFSAEKAGTYTFVVEYIARTGSANRAVNYAIDTTDTAKQVFLDLEESDEKRYAIVTADLTAGKHSFYFFPATGFDDTTIKSSDIYGWSAYFTKEAAKTIVATKTADTLSYTIALMTLAASCVAFTVCKKH